MLNYLNIFKAVSAASTFMVALSVSPVTTAESLIATHAPVQQTVSAETNKSGSAQSSTSAPAWRLAAYQQLAQSDSQVASLAAEPQAVTATVAATPPKPSVTVLAQLPSPAVTHTEKLEAPASHPIAKPSQMASRSVDSQTWQSKAYKDLANTAEQSESFHGKTIANSQIEVPVDTQNVQSYQAPVVSSRAGSTKQGKLASSVSSTSNGTVNQITPQVPSAPASVPANTVSANAPNHFSLGKHLGLGSNSRVQLNGFASVGAMKSDTSTGYNIPNRGTVDDDLNFGASTLIGLQFTAKLFDHIAAVAQFVANGDDSNGNKAYQVNTEWAFLRFNPTHSFEMKAGRFRLPLFMYSQTQQVGYTYPWMFLPNEVYRIVPFQNVNGIDSIYTIDVGNTGWAFDVETYYGENTSEYDMYTAGPGYVQGATVPFGTTADFTENNIMGFVGTLRNAYFTLRGTYVRVNLTGSIQNLVTSSGAFIPTLTFFSDAPSDFYSLGAKLNYHNFLLTGEYAHRSTPAQLTALSGFYAMLGYRYHKILPNLTYGQIWTTNDGSLSAQQNVGVAELSEQQRTVTLGIAYYINSNLVAKASVSDIMPLNGSAGLFNGNPGRHDVLLYGAELDAIF